MNAPNIVSADEWLIERKALLAREKAFNKQRDELSRARQSLPWVKVEKDYVFDGSNGPESLADLFEGRSQLMIYHFMYHPDWAEGCVSCSYWADTYNGIIVHLNARDVSLVAISKARLEQLEAYKQRLGWSFKWLSSLGNNFNRDYHVSLDEADRAAGNAYYNYEKRGFPMEEAPGMSVFAKDDTGQVFHTYSTYARGLDMFNATYHYLDAVPKGRDESELP